MMVHFADENAAHLTRSADAENSTSTGVAEAAVEAPALAVVNRWPDGFARAAELEQLGDSIAELAAHLHAATYRLLVMLAEFDRRGGWGGGFRSCAHWLSWRTRINLGAAREKVRVARALERLPQLSDALRRGELSYAIVRAVTRVASPENEEKLLELARHGTASQVERVVRAWRRVDRLEEQWVERERHRSRCLHLYPDDDGMYVLRGRLAPEVGALLERALAAATEALYKQPKQWEPASTETPSHTQRQADAIGLLAEWALGGGEVFAEQPDHEAATSASGAVECSNAAVSLAQDTTVQPVNEATPQEFGKHAEVAAVNPAPRPRPVTIGRAERFQVVVHVDGEAMRTGSDSGQAVLAGGIRISAETCRRIACDASRVVMIDDREGNVLDVGRRTRTVPAAIRRALDHRDQGCRFPGCGLRICDAHHIEHWIDGGKTKLTNLAKLCRRHHRAVHEEGFGVQMSAAGEISFTRPDGRPLPDAPAAPRLPADSIEQLVAAHEEMGLEIDAWTPTPLWHGERLDLHYAIRALRAV
jgi:hypothetical protein